MSQYLIMQIYIQQIKVTIYKQQNKQQNTKTYQQIIILFWTTFFDSAKLSNLLLQIFYNSLQSIQMRSNRNPPGDQGKPVTQRNIPNSERKTLTNNQNYGQTQPRNLNQQQLIQKMGKTINQALNRLPSHGKRTSISNVIQSNSSNLLSTIASLMNLIDHNFTKQHIDIPSIQNLLMFWGYPHSINKSVFQPVGAPHTWPVCLSMMQFLAEIGIFCFQYQVSFDDYRLDVEEIDFILEAYADNNCQQYQAYLQRQRASLTKEEEQLQYKIQSSQLTLRNIKNSQRSLAQMEEEQSALTQKLYRQNQNVIQIDQKNNSILNQIQKTEDLIQDLQNNKNNLLKRIALLQEQITTQQLSFEEATKIQCDIKDYNNRIKDAQNQAQSKKKQYQNQKTKVIQNFYKTVDDLNEIKNSIKKYLPQAEKKNIDIPLPQTDHVSFNQALHTEDMNLFNIAVSKIIQVDKIKTMLIGQETLAGLLEHQGKNLNSNLTDLQLKRLHLEGQNKESSSQVLKLQNYHDEIVLQIKNLNIKRAKNLQKITATKQRINQITLRNQQYLKKQIWLTQQAKQRKQHMIQGIKLLKTFEQSSEKSLEAFRQKQKETRAKIQQILQRIHSGFKLLNDQLEDIQ